MRKQKSGPSPAELRLRGELDAARRDLRRMKLALGVATDANDASDAADAAEAVEAAAQAVESAAMSEMEETLKAAAADLQTDTRRQITELTETRQRLSRLYFQQVDENRKRQSKLHQVLQNIWEISSERDLDRLLQRIADSIREQLGYGIVLVRLREPDTRLLKARAFSGPDPAARAEREPDEVSLDDFQSALKDECRVSRSYFISARPRPNTDLNGQAPDVDLREECEWQAGDRLLVPVTNQQGELVAALSVDEPGDRLVPSRESVELLEVFGGHAAVAIENARLLHQLESHTVDLESAGRRLQETHALKSNFISAVSHQLRTPLTAIRAYVDTLLAAREGDMSHEQSRKFLAIVNEEGQRLARLIESMLDLNRLDAGELRLMREKVDLAQVVEEAVGWLRTAAETGQVALKLQNAVADTRVEADRDQMRQLVVHLGGNAVKFTPAGGQVTLRLSGDERDIMLEVEDTGVGIPEPQLETIFDRSPVDASAHGAGAGLGLAICKSIVEWHGGRIFAESAPHMGARFTVVLPRRSGPRAAVRPQARPGAQDVLRLAIEMVSEVMGARVVSLMTPGPSGALSVQAAVGLDDSMLRDGSLPPGRGVAGWVAEHRRPVCVSNADEADRNGDASTGVGTYLSVPLEGRSGLLGVLSVTDPAGERPFDAEDCHLLLQLAERVSAAWEEAVSLEPGQRDVAATARTLRRALGEPSRGTASDRVRLVRALAREIGLPETEVGLVSFAASVQDLDLSEVVSHVKEAPVPSEARTSLERNSDLSAELLRPLEAMGAVRDIVLSRHEWWDGSGYPRGLKGDSIPAGGRILAVVDAWENLTVGRASRAAVSHEAALTELRQLRGRQFDPAAVDSFERAWGAVRDEQAGTAPEIRDAASASRG